MPSLQGRDGHLNGRRIRIVDTAVDLHRSLGLKIGTDDTQEEITLRNFDTPLGDQDPLFSGRLKLPFPSNHLDEGVVTLTSHDPLPVTIRGLNIGYEVEP